MRTAILIFRKHDSDAFEMLCGPDVPLVEQDGEFHKALVCGGVHPEIAELQRWESDSGLYRTLTFRKPEEVELANKKIADDLAAHEARHSVKESKKKGAKAAANAPDSAPTDL